MSATRSQHRIATRLLRTLSSLETRCTLCEDGTVPNTEALDAWQERMDALRPGYAPSDPYCGGSVAYFSALDECPPKYIVCPECSGVGMVLTEAGRAVAEFLARHGIGGLR